MRSGQAKTALGFRDSMFRDCVSRVCGGVIGNRGSGIDVAAASASYKPLIKPCKKKLCEPALGSDRPQDLPTSALWFGIFLGCMLAFGVRIVGLWVASLGPRV